MSRSSEAWRATAEKYREAARDAEAACKEWQQQRQSGNGVEFLLVKTLWNRAHEHMAHHAECLARAVEIEEEKP